MKTFAFGLLAIAAAALTTVQHRQLGQFRAENVSLRQAGAEADQLKADLAKSTGSEANAENEIARLREENRDLLKLRNQVYQLRQAAAQFQQVSAENQRLQSLAQNIPKPTRKDDLPQPTFIRVENLSNRGLNTPEDAAQTFFWAARDGNVDALSDCIVPERWSQIRDSDRGNFRQSFDHVESIEIVALRNLDANTVLLGIQYILSDNSRPDTKMVFTLKLRGGQWKLDIGGPNH